MLELLEELRAGAIAQDAQRLARLYALDGVHEFPFVVPGAPTRIEGRAAIAEFNKSASEAGRFAYREYRTISIHQAGDTVLVVEQEAVGSNTVTGVPFVLPNVWVIEVDEQGLIKHLRDYVNPLAVLDALGGVSGAFTNPPS